MVIVMHNFFTNVVHIFFIAFGVVLGASLFSGLGAIFTDHPPLKTMLNIASSIKIWAVAAALGGTFSTFTAIDKGLFEGEFKSIIKQVIYIFIALLGSNAGYSFIRLIQRCSEIWHS